MRFALRAGRAGARVLIFAALTLALCAPLAAVQALSENDVTLLLSAGASSQKIVTMVAERGVNFRMTPELAKKFRKLGASAELLQAIQNASQNVFPAAGPRPAFESPPPPPRPAANAQYPASKADYEPIPESHSPPSPVQEKINQVMASLASRPEPEGPMPVAPNFQIVDLNGRKLSLANYTHKVVLLDFWASWCPPCRKEIPEFVSLENQYQARGFQVIGIALDDHRPAIRRFYEQYDMNYPVAMGNDEIRQLYGGIHGLPTTFLIDRRGQIVGRFVGAPSNFASLEHWVKLLVEMPPAREAAPEMAAKAPAPAVAKAYSAAATTSAARAKADAPPDLSNPGPDEIRHIIQEFAAKETLFKEARDNYTYHQINKVETLDADNKPNGYWEQDWDILYDNNGNRIEKVTYAPADTLTEVGMTEQDIDAMRNIQPFVLTTDELPEYEIQYLGHVVLDKLTAYVFQVRPKVIQKHHQYFDGVVWVDDHDLQIVKSEGRQVPQVTEGSNQNLFPRFSTWRQQIDGKFWFPTFTMADDKLYFSGGPVHIKEIIRYTDYKQFKSTSTIKMVVVRGPNGKIEPAPVKPSNPSPPNHP